MQRFFGYYTNLLSSLVEHPTALLGEVEIITEEEKKQVLMDFNHSPDLNPVRRTLHRLFEEQAERTPERIVVVGEGYGRGVIKENFHLTYTQLNRSAYHYSERLKENGVRPGAIVALLIPRTVEMLIAVMAALKAGAAYMPIDPGYPRERIDYILKDSQAAFCISPQWMRERVEGSALPQSRDASGQRANDPAAAAYVIYTSGSTGKPKGVLIRQDSVVNLVQGLETRVYGQYLAPLNIALVAPYVFDASVKTGICFIVAWTYPVPCWRRGPYRRGRPDDILQLPAD